MKKRNILVTGGTGFIGSRLVKRLLRTKANVIIISRNVRNPEIKKLVERGEIQLVQCDLTNQRELNKFKNILKNVEFIVHLAAFVPKKSDEDSLSKSMKNIRGTLNLLSMFNGIERFCFGSTTEVYGRPIYCPLDENHPTNPLTYYGASKLVCEKYLQVYLWRNNLPLTILRFSSVYGEGETIDRAIPNFIKSVCVGNAPVIYGNGSDLRDYVYVDDVVDGIILSLKHGKNKVYNIARGEGLSIKKIVEQIIKLSGKNLVPKFEKVMKEKVDYIFDISQARKDLHYSPRIRFEDGLKREMEWFEESLEKRE